MRLAHQLGCLLLAAGLQALLIGIAILVLESRAEDAPAKTRGAAAKAASASAAIAPGPRAPH